MPFRSCYELCLLWGILLLNLSKCNLCVGFSHFISVICMSCDIHGYEWALGFLLQFGFAHMRSVWICGLRRLMCGCTHLYVLPSIWGSSQVHYNVIMTDVCHFFQFILCVCSQSESLEFSLCACCMWVVRHSDSDNLKMFGMQVDDWTMFTISKYYVLWLKDLKRIVCLKKSSLFRYLQNFYMSMISNDISTVLPCPDTQILSWAD